MSSPPDRTRTPTPASWRESIDAFIANNLHFAVCCIGLSFQLIYGYPGELSHDADVIYRGIVAGKYDDWHSPLLGFLIEQSNKLSAVFLDRLPASATMFVLTSIAYWLALYLISYRIKRISNYLALFVLIIGFSPNLFQQVSIVGKDSGLVISWLLAFGLMVNTPTRDKYLKQSIFQGLSLILTLYGLTIRPNSIFAALPLIILWSYNWRPSLSIKGLLVASLAIWLSLTTISSYITYSIFHSSKTHPVQYILMSDIFAINYLTKSFHLPEVIAKNSPHLTNDVFQIRYEYSANIDWAYWGKNDIRMHFVRTDDEFKQLLSSWFRIVWNNFPAYIHAKNHFFLELFTAEKRSWLRSRLLYEGWVSLLILLTSVLLFSKYLYKEGENKINLFGLVMSLSGLLYLCPYYVFNATPAYRYLFWGITSSYISLILLLGSRLDRRNTMPLRHAIT
jgi:hypothetical protein